MNIADKDFELMTPIEFMNAITLLECDKVKGAPAAIVSCASSLADYRSAKVACSATVRVNSYELTPKLESALRTKLGEIGTKRKGCKNYIGACAEPHAARQVLIDKPEAAINDLVFGLAYRPRTKNKVPYCKNCEDVFNVRNK